MQNSLFVGKIIKLDKILTIKENASNTDYLKNFCLSEHTIKKTGSHRAERNLKHVKPTKGSDPEYVKKSQKSV